MFGERSLRAAVIPVGQPQGSRCRLGIFAAVFLLLCFGWCSARYQLFQWDIANSRSVKDRWSNAAPAWLRCSGAAQYTNRKCDVILGNVPQALESDCTPAHHKSYMQAR